MLFRNTLILLLTISFTSPVLSCNCVGNRSIQEAVSYNDGIVSGTVIGKSYVTVIDSTILRTFHFDSIMINKASEILIARYEILVHDNLKGDFIQDTLLVYSGIGSFDCGSRLKVGKKYIIYGKKETYFSQKNGFQFPEGQNILWTYRCLRTTLFDSKELDKINRFLN